MAGCEDCYFRTPKVGTRGPIDSPFVIIAESPGIEEVVEGIPLIGPAGTVINETLIKMGHNDSDIQPLFTNAIQCLPQQKDSEKITSACMACRPRMLQELQAYPRKVILSLGGPALQSLLNDFSLKITRERGKLFKTPLASVGIVAAVHPAFLLRGGGNYQQFERDIKYAINLMRDGINARKLPNGCEYEVLKTEAEVKDFVALQKSLPPKTDIASDIETTGFNYQTDRILYCGFQYHPFKSVIVPGHLLTKGLFATHLNWIWQNGKFDCRFLRHKGFQHARVDDDLMLISYSQNERRGIHDLDQIASDWLGSPNHKHMVDYIYKTWFVDARTGIKRRGNLSDLPPALVEEYLARDLNDTYHGKVMLKPNTEKDPNTRKFYNNHLIPGSEYLLKLELNGILVDQEWVMEQYYRLLALCNQYEEEINVHARKAGLGNLNPRSWQQIKALLYTRLGLAPISWATDDDTLEKLPKHPVVKSLQGYRKHAKSLSTYVKPLMTGGNRSLLLDAKGKPTKKETAVYPDGRTHSSYLLHGTPTSRLACRDLNVQNIPRDPLLRGMFKARDGYMILEVDYSQAELRSLAALSLCKDLMEIFITGKDLHNEFTQFLFGDGWTREDKMAAKTVNFGIPYGREAPSIAADPDLNRGRNISVEEAQSWIDGWSRRFPGAWKFIGECRLAPIRGQTITTCFGNKKRPGVVSREKLHTLQNESANFPHQSIASNLTIRAGIELIDPLRDQYDTHIINTVHDCIVAEVPKSKDIIIEVASVMQKKMEEIPTRFKGLNVIPFKAEAELGHHWGNILKFKEIEAKYDWDLEAIPNYIPAH